jgi:hypothetical protein
MNNNATPLGAHEPLDEGGIHADGCNPCGVETTGGISTQQEFVTTHMSSVCKKVYVDSGNDKTILYVLSIGLEHDMCCQLVLNTTMNLPLFPLNRNHGRPFQRTHSAHPRTLIS